MGFNLIPFTDQQKLRQESKEYEVSRNLRSQEQERERVMDQMDAIRPLEDDEEGFRLFQEQRHAGDKPEDLDGLGYGQISAKIEERDRVDRVAWEAFKKQPGVIFMRQHPEVSDSDVTQINLQLAEWNITTPSLGQLNQAYTAVKNHGLSRPKAAHKAAESEQVLYDMDLEKLADLCGGLQTSGRPAPSGEYKPSGLGSRHFGVGTTHEPGEE